MALNLANQTAEAKWDQKRDRDRISQLEQQLRVAQERAEIAQKQATAARKDLAALTAEKPGQAAQVAAQRQMEQSLKRTASERDALSESHLPSVTILLAGGAGWLAAPQLSFSFLHVERPGWSLVMARQGVTLGSASVWGRLWE